MLLCMVLQSLLLLHFFLPFATSQIGVQTGNWGIQPNGTYRNPIIAGDYSDPDVLSENGEYYLVRSTFWFSPGFIILRFRDLVSWEMFGSVLLDIVEACEFISHVGIHGRSTVSKLSANCSQQ